MNEEDKKKFKEEYSKRTVNLIKTIRIVVLLIAIGGLYFGIVANNDVLFSLTMIVIVLLAIIAGLIVMVYILMLIYNEIKK